MHNKLCIIIIIYAENVQVHSLTFKLYYNK